MNLWQKFPYVYNLFYLYLEHNITKKQRAKISYREKFYSLKDSFKMKKFLKIFFGIIVILSFIAAIAWFGFLKPKPPSISPEDRAQIQLMPLPAELSLKKGEFIIAQDLGYSFKETSSPRMEKAIDRFYSKLSSKTGISFEGKSVPVLILDCKNTGKQYPTLDDDESYSISITSNEIIISANFETGIIFGLESLLQLAKEQDSGWIFPAMELNDQPRYPWRGLMIDLGRHWIPKKVILRNLDAMASLKMNVLHLHLSEYQGFRVESKQFPKLHGMGSEGNYLSQKDTKELIEYAADRGIRVVPEFDLPGHATSWFIGHPELASAAGPYELDTKFGISDPVMDPTKEIVYEFLDQFFEEMASLFPDEYLHIGGDEVKPKHWDENLDIQKFMQENDLAGDHELQAYFNIRLQKILEKHGKQMMGWDEIIHPDLPKDGIAVQSWRSQKSLWEAAANGNKAVLSAGYYLDHKQSAAYHYNVDPMIIPNAVTFDIDSTNWKMWDCKLYVKDLELEGSMYLFGEGENLRGIMNFMEDATGFTDAVLKDGSLVFSHESQFGNVKYDLNMLGDSIIGEAKIALFSIVVKGHKVGGSDMSDGKALPNFDKIEALTPEQEDNILGGEACMWTEMVDAKTIESRIWPRAGAIAEKLWSPMELTTDETDMYRRLIVLDDNLEKLGLKHKESSDLLIRDMVEEKYVEALQTLVGVLQEDILFNRMIIYDPELYTYTALNRIVDAARPESYIAYEFDKDVDLWIEIKDEEAKTRLVRSLEIWSGNYEALASAFESEAGLKEVELHSVNLSELSKLGLEAINDPGSLKNRNEKINRLLEKGANAYGGMILPVTKSITKLVENVR